MDSRVAPDTTGLNFFRADPSLADLLQLYLPAPLWHAADAGPVEAHATELLLEGHPVTLTDAAAVASA